MKDKILTVLFAFAALVVGEIIAVLTTATRAKKSVRTMRRAMHDRFPFAGEDPWHEK